MRRLGVARFLLVAVVAGLLAAPAASAQAAATWTVNMVDHLYSPAELNITVGDVVTWNNTESHNDDHTVTSRVPRRNEEDPTGPLQSGVIAPGESFTFTFTEPGDYHYYCRIHGFDMSGLVRVRAPGVPFAVDDQLSANKDADAEPAIGTVNVLKNDFDREGDNLGVSSYDQATMGGGAVECTQDGDCVYTSPVAACNSGDSFGYTVSDGTRSDSATVTVKVACGATAEASETQATLRLRRHLRATGALVAEATACRRGRAIKVQRSVPSGWKTVGSGRSTRSGAYAISIKDRPGTYRAKVARSTLSSGQKCKGDVSSTRRHSH